MLSKSILAQEGHLSFQDRPVPDTAIYKNSNKNQIKPLYSLKVCIKRRNLIGDRYLGSICYTLTFQQKVTYLFVQFGDITSLVQHCLRWTYTYITCHDWSPEFKCLLH